jgi:biotin carboxylase
VPRILLLLPTATYRASDFLSAAARLGVEVVVGSEHRQALSGAMGDRALVVPLADTAAAVAAIVLLHHRTPLDAVLAVDDQGVIVAALAAQQLGLRHSPPGAVAGTRDKAVMRQRLTAALPQPHFGTVPPGADVAAVAAEIGYPSVVKPVSRSASQGVIRVDDPAQAEAAEARIRAIIGNDSEPLLVEAYLPGPEVAVEGLLQGGELEVLAVFDKPDPMDGPYFEETIYVTPSRQPTAVRAAVESTVGRAAAALGLREGPVHAELRIHPSGAATVLELAARSIGGLCARSLRFGAGVSLEEVIIRHALGMGLEGLAREAGASGVMMMPIRAAGVLDKVTGVDEARAVVGVVGVEISIPAGRPLVPLPEGDRYLGFIFARADTPQQVEDALRRAESSMQVHLR